VGDPFHHKAIFNIDYQLPPVYSCYHSLSLPRPLLLIRWLVGLKPFAYKGPILLSW